MAESSAFEKVVGFRVIFDILGFVFTAVDLFLWLVGLSGTPLWVVGSVGFTLFVVGIVGHVSANAESSYLTLGDLRGDLVSPHKEFSRSPAKIREPPEQPPLRLTVRIIETFVLPHKDGTAECFLQLSVHNETEVKCSNPLKYGVSLTINKKSYAFTSPLNLHDFKIVQYKIVEKWHDGEPYEAEQELAKTSLRLNVLGEKDYLLKGKPLLGWLGVQVHYLPKWKYHEELIRYNEYSRRRNRRNPLRV